MNFERLLFQCPYCKEYFNTTLPIFFRHVLKYHGHEMSALDYNKTQFLLKLWEDIEAHEKERKLTHGKG